MDIFDVLRMIGGLCLFLFGMNVMGEALERSAGSKLESILAKLTTNKLAGFLTGLHAFQPGFHGQQELAGFGFHGQASFVDRIWEGKGLRSGLFTPAQQFFGQLQQFAEVYRCQQHEDRAAAGDPPCRAQQQDRRLRK